MIISKNRIVYPKMKLKKAFELEPNATQTFDYKKRCMTFSSLKGGQRKLKSKKNKS